MTHSATVGPMHKITLSLTAAGTDPGKAATGSTRTVAFIFGIGTEGMSAFEQALLGQPVGFKMSIRVEHHTMHTYFEHLLCPVMEGLNSSTPFDLNVEILSVAPVSDREMVQALAQKSGGCGGDCGCGCA